MEQNEVKNNEEKPKSEEYAYNFTAPSSQLHDLTGNTIQVTASSLGNLAATTN
jgi:hypothetical protein